MATLFALGVLSLAWMALIAVEKLLPPKGAAKRIVALVLLALGLAILLAGDLVPGIQGEASGAMDM